MALISIRPSGVFDETLFLADELSFAGELPFLSKLGIAGTPRDGIEGSNFGNGPKLNLPLPFLAESELSEFAARPFNSAAASERSSSEGGRRRSESDLAAESDLASEADVAPDKFSLGAFPLRAVE